MTATVLTEQKAGLQPTEAEAAVRQAPAEAEALPAKRHGRRWALIALAIAALGGGGWYALHERMGAAQAKDAPPAGGKAELRFAEADGGGAGIPAARVETVHVEVVPCPDRLRVTGTLTADEQSSVASNVNGIVAEVRVERGSIVKKGDVLVQLDPTDATNRLAEGVALAEELKAKLTLDEAAGEFVAEEQPKVMLAKAALDLMISRVKRAEVLLPNDAISADECEQVKSEYECTVQRHRQALQEVREDYQKYRTAIVRLDALRKALADTTIVAPFDGIIAEKKVAVGEQVTGGFVATSVVTMVRIDPLRLTLTVPQQAIGQIIPGGKVFFHVDSYPGRTFEALVRYISPVVTSDTRSLVIEAVTPNPDGGLRPGLFATAELELPQKQSKLLLPAAAVRRTGEVARVFVVRDGVAREQVVALGEEAGGKVEIRSGLTGDELVLSRSEVFRDGDKLQP